MTKTFKHINELFQRAMTLLVKSAISEEFIEWILFPLKLHDFKQLEHVLGD